MTTTELQTTFDQTFRDGRARLAAIVRDLLGDLRIPADVPDVEFTVTDFDLTPETGEFSLTAASTEDWQLPLGVSGLLLEDLSLTARRADQDGVLKVTATIAGTLRIGATALALSLDLPGDYRLTARIPTLDLSPVLQDLCGTAAMLGFPAPASVVNAKLRDISMVVEPTAGRVAVAGHSPLGACEVVVGRTGRGGWAFVGGFAPPSRWNLSTLDAGLRVLDELTLEDTVLVLASDPDAGLELATIELPAGVQMIRGLTLVAGLELGGLGVDDLLRLERVTVSAAIGSNPLDLRLEAGLQGTLQLSSNVALGNMAFVLRPAPGNFSLGIKGEVLARLDRSDLVFVGTMLVRPIERSASFAATMLGAWQEPYGIKGLAIADLAIDVGIGIVPPPAVVAPIVGFAGSLRIGSFAGSAAVKLDTANPGKSMVAARFDELRLRDVLETFCSPQILAQIPADARRTILGIGLHDVEVQAVPQPTQIGELVYEPGFRFAGQLSIQGFRAEFGFALDHARGCAVHAAMDRITIGDAFAISGSGGDPRPSLAVNLLAGSAVGVEISGRVRLLGAEADARISLSDAGFAFLVQGRIFDLFEASLDARGSDLRQGGDFYIRAAMRNDLLSYLRQQAVAEIQRGADQAVRDLTAAQEALSGAQRVVAGLQREIDANRQIVRREREVAERDLQAATGAVRAAQEEVDKLERQVRSARETVAAERRRDQDRLRSAQAAVAGAQATVSSLQSEISSSHARIATLNGLIKKKRRWFDDSAWYQKSYRWAEFSAYAAAKGAEITALYTKIGGLETAKNTANLALEGARQTLRGIERAAATFPIDVDPRVSGPLAARGAATLALEAARQALAGARAAVKGFPVDADPRVLGPLGAMESATLVLEGARRSLDGVKAAVGGMADVAQFITEAGLGGVLDLKQVAFEGQLNAVKGGQVSLQAKLVFMRRDLDVAWAFNFHNPLAGAKALGQKLIRSVT